MNPSSRNHHRQTTRLVTGAGHHQDGVDAQLVWGIKNFVRTTRRCRILKIKADNQSNWGRGLPARFTLSAGLDRPPRPRPQRQSAGIVNDPNERCDEHDDPTYIVDPIKKVITVSVETMTIIDEIGA